MKNDIIKLDSKICYDSIEIIYYTYPKGKKAFSMCLDFTDIKTYYDLINHIQKQEDLPIHSMIIIAERGLDGIVLRWNHSEGLFQVGTTRGYA